LDANHPLAGIAIRLRMRVESVREASQEELQRGSTGSGFFRIEAIVDPGYEQRTLH
jgi:FKBP-type peptidyl-prolyl cis-trans isomerase SlyD